MTIAQNRTLQVTQNQVHFLIYEQNNSNLNVNVCNYNRHCQTLENEFYELQNLAPAQQLSINLGVIIYSYDASYLQFTYGVNKFTKYYVLMNFQFKQKYQEKQQTTMYLNDMIIFIEFNHKTVFRRCFLSSDLFSFIENNQQIQYDVNTNCFTITGDYLFTYIMDKGNTYVKTIYQKNPDPVIMQEQGDSYQLYPAEQYLLFQCLDNRCQNVYDAMRVDETQYIQDNKLNNVYLLETGWYCIIGINNSKQVNLSIFQVGDVMVYKYPFEYLNLIYILLTLLGCWMVQFMVMWCIRNSSKIRK